MTAADGRRFLICHYQRSAARDFVAAARVAREGGAQSTVQQYRDMGKVEWLRAAFFAGIWRPTMASVAEKQQASRVMVDILRPLARMTEDGNL